MALAIDIEKLLQKERIESNRIELKKGWNPTSIYRTICAFANDFDNIGGGYILVRVEEEDGIAKRPISGVPMEAIDEIQKSMPAFNSKMNPYYLPRTSVEHVDGRILLAIWVPAGIDRPYEVCADVLSKKATSKAYIRIGSSTVEAKGEALAELRDLGQRTPFDDRGNGQITLDALSPILLYDHLRRVKSRLAQTFQALPIENIMEQMDLFHGPTERRYIKNVAAMMFCEEPHRFFPCTQVEIVHFPKRAEASPNVFHAAPVIRGSVPQIIRSTLDYLRTMVIRGRIRKLPDVAEAQRYFNYPYQTLEEAVVNAMYHRDYQSNEPVEITIEPHAISILSHAGPDRSISREALRAGGRLQTRRYRNLRLFE